MGSIVNSVSRRRNTPVSFRLHAETFIPVSTYIRGYLDYWGWVSSVPILRRSLVVSTKRRICFEDTLRSWVEIRGNCFARLRARQSYFGTVVDLYVFGRSINTAFTQYRSKCLLFGSKLNFSTHRLFSTSFVEERLTLQHSSLDRSFSVVTILIHDLLVLVIGNYSSFISDLSASLKLGYSGRFSRKYFISGIHSVVSIFQLPFPNLLGFWLRSVIEYNRRLTSSAINFIKEAMFCFDPLVYKLRGFSLVVKGRIGGSDKSIKQAVRWGQMPAETLSSAVITRFTPSFTPHGVIGVRVRLYFISNYVQLNFFLLLFLFYLLVGRKG